MDQNSVQDRTGILYMITCLGFIGMLNNIAIYPTERNVFYREYVDGGYSVMAFFLTYFILAIPFIFLSAIITSILLTYVTQLASTQEAFLVFVYVTFCFMLVGECLGVAFCSAIYHIGFSVNIMSVIISLFNIMAGYLSVQMPFILKRFNDISPLKWGSVILANVALKSVDFTCDENEKYYGECPIATGQQVLELYQLDDRSVGGDYNDHLIALGSIVAFFFVVAYVALRLKGYTLSH